MKKMNLDGQSLVWLLTGVVSSVLAHYLLEVFYYNYDYKGVYDWIINSRLELFLLGTAVLFILYVLFSTLMGSSLMGGSA